MTRNRRKKDKKTVPPTIPEDPGAYFQESALLSLPMLAQENILSYLAMRDVGRLQKTCKFVYELCASLYWQRISHLCINEGHISRNTYSTMLKRFGNRIESIDLTKLVVITSIDVVFAILDNCKNIQRLQLNFTSTTDLLSGFTHLVDMLPNTITHLLVHSDNFYRKRLIDILPALKSLETLSIALSEDCDSTDILEPIKHRLRQLELFQFSVNTNFNSLQCLKTLIIDYSVNLDVDMLVRITSARYLPQTVTKLVIRTSLPNYSKCIDMAILLSKLEALETLELYCDRLIRAICSFTMGKKLVYTLVFHINDLNDVANSLELIALPTLELLKLHIKASVGVGVKLELDLYKVLYQRCPLLKKVIVYAC